MMKRYDNLPRLPILCTVIIVIEIETGMEMDVDRTHLVCYIFDINYRHLVFFFSFSSLFLRWSARAADVGR